MTYIKFLTHRALTNNTPLKDILALLILERQKKIETIAMANYGAICLNRLILCCGILLILAIQIVGKKPV